MHGQGTRPSLEASHALVPHCLPAHALKLTVMPPLPPSMRRLQASLLSQDGSAIQQRIINVKIMAAGG